MMLRSYKDGKSCFADRKKPRELAQKVVDELGVLTPDLDTPIRKLSGGNVQKILVGRELSFNPSLLMAAYVVRGLDINTSYAIYGLLNDLKKKGGRSHFCPMKTSTFCLSFATGYLCFAAAGSAELLMQERLKRTKSDF